MEQIMPLPMVHLGIAVQLGELKEQILTPEFLLGSIAPDAIHMRPNSDREAKSATHLLIPEDGQDERMQLLLEQRNSSAKSDQAFAAGYIAHILTDRFWIDTVIKPYRNRIPVTVDKSAQRTLYYAETDQIDFDLYNYAPWRSGVWDALEQAKAVEFAPLLTADEIWLWQDRTLRWFTELKEEPKIEPKYLTNAVIGDFMAKATVHIAKILDNWCTHDYL